MQRAILFILILFYSANCNANQDLVIQLISSEKETLIEYSSNKIINTSIKLEVENSTFFNKNNSIFKGIYLGSLAIIILINLIFFFTLRDKSYLLFSIYIVLLLLFAVAIVENNFKLKLFINFLVYAFFIVLSIKLLNFEKIKNSIYKIFLGISYFLLIVSLPIVLNDNYIEFLNKYSNYLNLLFLIAIVIITIVDSRERHYFSKYFLLAIILIVIEGVFVFTNNIYSSTLLNFINYYRLGTFFSGLIIAYSLLLHFINKLKDTQQQVVFKLEEMNTLKENINLKLDKKVQQRTNELQKVNNLLNEQNKEINAKKNEIENIVYTLEDANEQIIEQKELIEETHKKITDSINSASYIQAAMLPKKDIFKTHFNDFFIYYKPRDIVSGDFYWVKKIENNIIITVADCTGHGVPGALVSMLGISLLTEIVRKEEVTTASLILEKLRTALKLSLQQKGNENEATEGIDMVLCIINLETKTMQYAGANNSIYIIRKESLNNLKPTQKVRIHKGIEENNSENILVEIKGDSQPIGVYRKERPFSNHKIQLLPNDVLYLFTDGFVDQFGGKKGYKFRIRPFKNLLLNIQDSELKSHEALLGESFINWKNTQRQLDDVLVMGLKI